MKLKKWEFAAALAIAVTVLITAVASAGQAQLSDKLIRLHVLANSDSEQDQSLKLKVRDRVLTELTPVLEGVTDRDAAEKTIMDNMQHVIAAAEEEIKAQGYDYGVSARISEESFPTREYETFSLPAGNYLSLRVEIGEAEGKNWWCVVFPPICISAATDSDMKAMSLTSDEVSLITEDKTEYVVKFKLMEIFGDIKNALSKAW